MNHVIWRDDDACALTPAEYLDRLYRPFLDQNLPVHLAVIPNVRTDTTYRGGHPEGFLVAKKSPVDLHLPISAHQELVRYLQDNPGYEILQHGYNHEIVNRSCEFEKHDSREIVRRLEQGTHHLLEAGFPRPQTFVAPYDRFTRTSIKETAKRFPIISSCWFELRRLPFAWWPRYFLKKARRLPHWTVGKTLLLSHSGCHLSYHQPYDKILQGIRDTVREQHLTVLVTHWWEFFRDNKPDEKLIRILHETADYLACDSNVQVIRFSDLLSGKVRLNG
jgi:hypothetical protein